ncbi:hypothetical protein A3Q56_05590 [Intoshia linei]|uniref:DOMON domain-containing protein n=1 Tax=Intoshia linei TaxID=1819745 RepID=A0A177AXJ0_9BILA|nr:hypothetical protein A3Q56_05590 [Intoshia linei]
MNFKTILLILICYPSVSSLGMFQFDYISYHNENGKEVDYFSSCDMYIRVEIHENDKIYIWDNYDKKSWSNSNVLVYSLPYT